MSSATPGADLAYPRAVIRVAVVAAALVLAILPRSTTAAQPSAGVVPVARTSGVTTVALAGDRLVIGSQSLPGIELMSAPISGGEAVTLFSMPVGPQQFPILYDLDASVDRVVFTTAEVDSIRERVLRLSAWGGSRAGPFERFVLYRGGPWRPLEVHVSGTTVAVSEIKSETGARRHFIFSPGSPGVRVEASAAVRLVDLAGSLVAFVDGARQLVVRDWASGIERLRYTASGPVGSLDLAEDGRVLLHVPSKAKLELIDPSGGVRRLATGRRGGGDARLAGDSAVLRSRGLFEGDGHIAVIDLVTGKRRRLSPASLGLDRDPEPLDAIAVQEDLVAWAANGCAFVAPIAGQGSTIVPPGPCPRAEIHLEDDQPDRLRGRTVRVRLRCISAPPPGCRGRLRLALQRPLGGARYLIPTGRRGIVRVRLTRHGVAALRRRSQLPFHRNRAHVRVRTTLIDGARPRDATPNEGIVLRPGREVGTRDTPSALITASSGGVHGPSARSGRSRCALMWCRAGAQTMHGLPCRCSSAGSAHRIVVRSAFHGGSINLAPLPPHARSRRPSGARIDRPR
jgi:hypothetical protein